ncbi:MAG: sulfoxide reductase heme-binding subunit YedZ [Acidobacteria bacterium]|nr:sulfoxide reductase heme-binding subunit YedZ [Acidobacteriota bacterium]
MAAQVKSILAAKWTKVLVFMLCLAPLATLAWRGLQDKLGANPVENITHFTGDWTLTLLLVTLAITPARKLLKQPVLIRFRRMVGLFAFFYGCLHFTTYLWLDKFFDLPEMLKDIAIRRFITIGFAGFVLLIPLAVTSTAGWVQRLGGKYWQRLHRLVYLSATAGVVHYYWLVKSDITKPVRYGVILAVLIGYRAAVSVKKRRSARAPAPGHPRRSPRPQAEIAASRAQPDRGGALSPTSDSMGTNG